MYKHPFEAFFATLQSAGIRVTVKDYDRVGTALATGGPWSLQRLRDTLAAILARDTDQIERFHARFGMFFEPPWEERDGDAKVDPRQVLADLKKALGDAADVSDRRDVSGRPRRARLADGTARPGGDDREKGKPKKVFGAWLRLAILLALFAATCALGIWQYLPKEKQVPREVPVVAVPVDTGEWLSGGNAEPSSSEPSPSESSPSGPSPAEPPRIRMREYSDMPFVTGERYEPQLPSQAWKGHFAAAALLLASALLFALYLWRSSRIEEDPPEPYTEGESFHFPLGRIGGSASPFLDDETLNVLADSMGHYRSGKSGNVLDARASIASTLKRGGVPSLEFFTRKQTRGLLILEDEFAEASSWNPVPKELAAGMEKRGIPVLRARFKGVPETFCSEDGPSFRMEDVEQLRKGTFLLIFTDGKGLPKDKAWILEDMRKWPMKAWMDLRGPRFWDESVRVPVAFGIPVFPATRTGLKRAFRRVLAERGDDPDFSDRARSASGIPEPAGMSSEAYAETLLGDALPWARDCAMMQPMPLGLADKLRLRFHEHLPPERIERLLALPGTVSNVSGLLFSEEIHKVLRDGFIECRSEKGQDDVLRFIVKRIEDAGQSERDELPANARLTWSMARECVRLELDRRSCDEAAKTLARLWKTPLGTALESDLDAYDFTEQSDKKPRKRIKSTNRQTWQRLARINPGSGIDVLKKFPLPLWHRVMLGAMGLACFVFTALGLYDCLKTPPANIGFEPKDGVFATIESKVEGEKPETWREVAAGEIQKIASDAALAEGQGYLLWLYEKGERTKRAFDIRPNAKTILAIGRGPEKKPCREELLGTELVVQRCPDEGSRRDLSAVSLPSWKEALGELSPPGREMSVGMAFISDEGNDEVVETLGETLLATRSVDKVYRVSANGTGRWPAESVDEAVNADLSPWLAKSQLICWGEPPDELSEFEVLFDRFDKVLHLGVPDDAALLELEKLFEPGRTVAVSEPEILGAWPEAVSAGKGDETVLTRTFGEGKMAQFLYASILKLFGQENWKKAQDELVNGRELLNRHLDGSKKKVLERMGSFFEHVTAAEREAAKRPRTTRITEESLRHYEAAIGILSELSALGTVIPEAKRIEDSLAKTAENLRIGITAETQRFIAYDNGTVLDKTTGLMWAAKDNGKDVTWKDAKEYCEKHEGGGYTDWRMPTQEELYGLYDPNEDGYEPECSSLWKVRITGHIHLTCYWVWASETKGESAAGVYFAYGPRDFGPQGYDLGSRALPVRRGN